jgi:hypothetical protein
MTATTKRPTVASVHAGLNDLTRQVQANQAAQQERIAGIETRLDQLAHWERDGKEKIRTEFGEYRTATDQKNSVLTERVNEIGRVIDVTAAEIKRTVGILQESLDARLASFPAQEPAFPLPSLPSPGSFRAAFRKSGWYPWLKIAFWAVAGVLAWHYLLVPVLMRSVTPSLLPNVVRPSRDVSTPTGIASLEVSREPFRSDTASRKSFGIIFARLDELVRSGRLVNFEGYYHEFRRELAGTLRGKNYDDWRGVWNRIAETCHQYGGGADDLHRFHANLMSAARVVADTGSASGTELYRWELSGSPDDVPTGFLPGSPSESAATAGFPSDPQPFFPYRSTLTDR